MNQRPRANQNRLSCAGKERRAPGTCPAAIHFLPARQQPVFIH
jgi:hypothetical protein